MESNQKENEKEINELLDDILYRFADEILMLFDEDKNDILDKTELRKAFLCKLLILKSGGDANNLDE